MVANPRRAQGTEKPKKAAPPDEIPHYSELAERAILAALVQNARHIPEDFDPHWLFRAQHQTLAEFVIEIRNRGEQIGMVSLVEGLADAGKLEAAGGSDPVSDLWEERPSEFELARAFTIVQRNYFARQAEKCKTDLTLAAARGEWDAIKDKLVEIEYWQGLRDGADAKTKPTRFRFLTVEELEGMQPAKGIIGDVLYEDSIAYLYGPSGRWKSFVAIDWALCIAAGRTWLGRETKRGRVIYVAAEGARGIKKRIRAWKLHHHYTGSIDLRLVPQPVNLMDAEQVQAFIADIEAQDESPVLIVIDTLARSMAGGDENSTQDANIIGDSLGAIKAAFGCCVLCVHHTGKELTRGMRGSYAFFGNADTVVMVSGKEGEARIEPGETIKLASEKPKDNDPFEDIILTTRKVEWATDDGEFMSSLVIVPGDGSSAPDASRLALSSRTAVLTLASFPEGVKTTAWCNATGLKKSTFMHQSLPDLLRRGLVVQLDGVNRLTPAGDDYCRGAVGAGGAKVVHMHRK